MYESTYYHGLTGKALSKLKAYYSDLTCDRIGIGDRMTELDRENVEKLKSSIQEKGLVQPIVVRQSRDGEESYPHWVVIGAHRLTAWQELAAEAKEKGDAEGMVKWNSIPCIVLTSDVSPEDVQWIEIVENLHRRELSPEKKKELGARLLDLMDLESTSGTFRKKKEKGDKSWFMAWAEEAGYPKQTAIRIWQQFREATGETRTPAKAADKKQAFRDWLERSAKAKHETQSKETPVEKKARVKAKKAKAEKAPKVTELLGLAVPQPAVEPQPVVNEKIVISGLSEDERKKVLEDTLLIDEDIIELLNISYEWIRKFGKGHLESSKGGDFWIEFWEAGTGDDDKCEGRFAVMSGQWPGELMWEDSGEFSLLAVLCGVDLEVTTAGEEEQAAPG